MKAIVASTDFSQRSAAAVERAAAIAKGSGASLQLVHAVDDALPETLQKKRIVEAQELLEQQAARLDVPNVSIEAVAGDIFWVIHRAATKARADLIVAGDHRRSPIRDIFRDTTVERLIRVSALPVLIARGPVREKYRHALIAVENEEGRELADILAGFGAAGPARATVLHAFSAPVAGLMYYAGVESEKVEAHTARIAREARSRLAASLADARLPTEIRIVDAPPARAIADFVEQEKCDVVAVSSHARRSAIRGILGSVSSELIRQGATDVLVAPRVV